MTGTKKNIKADLHIHSNFSDGKFSPAELIQKAKVKGFSAISITDHDNINAIDEAKMESEKYEIEVIPGIEFSTDYIGKEVHVLAYFIDYKDTALIDFIKKIRNSRIERLRQMIHRLAGLNCLIDVNRFFDKFPSNITLGRPHLALEMVQNKFVKNYVEAFIKFIGDGKPAYVKKPNPEIKTVLGIISDLGGLSFIAHPGKNFKNNQIQEIIDEGVDGIEIIHPSHTYTDTNFFQKVSAQNYLLESGGSDFHGIVKTDFENFGSYYVTDKEIINMKRRLY
ncbi:MAG: PHP domain-containing protein [Ignavibacteriae bacterium]|nr:PHP domain-containing protein [Ignavibacteriota bacterium]